MPPLTVTIDAPRAGDPPPPWPPGGGSVVLAVFLVMLMVCKVVVVNSVMIVVMVVIIVVQESPLSTLLKGFRGAVPGAGFSRCVVLMLVTVKC